MQTKQPGIYQTAQSWGMTLLVAALLLLGPIQTGSDRVFAMEVEGELGRANPQAQGIAAVKTAPATPDVVELRINAIGDVNMNRNRVPVYPQGADVWGTMVPFSSFTEKLTPIIDGDVNFANIETVITDRNDFEPPTDKAFAFRTHPNGIEEVIKAGFNLFGLANNHAFDYGPTGVTETRKHLKLLAEKYPIAYTGVGLSFDDAIAPAVIEVKGVRIGLVAVGIGQSNHPSGCGVAHVYHYQKALARLRDAEVDLRIFSVHDGKEGTLVPIDRQMRFSREAIRDYNVDIVFNHHPHRSQGVELYGDGVIYWGLGNGIMRGAMDLSLNKANYIERDFGLLARLNVTVDKKAHRNTITRLEVVPLLSMQEQPHALAPEDAAARVAQVNHLSSSGVLNQLWNSSAPPSDKTKKPLVFNPREYYGYIDLQ